MSFPDFAASHLKCPRGRVMLVADASSFDLGAIERGAVFVYAIWSGPAVVALEAFTQTLNELTPAVPVWVLDHDSIPESEHRSKFDGYLGGNGELFFYRDGIRVAEIRPAHRSSPARSREPGAREWHERYRADVVEKWRAAFGTEGAAG